MTTNRGVFAFYDALKPFQDFGCLTLCINFMPKRMADARIEDAQASIKDSLLSFRDMGTSLLTAHNDNQSLDQVIEWPDLEVLVATAGKLTGTVTADPIGHVTCGLGRFQRYAARMLRVLEIEAEPVCQPLLSVPHLIRDKISRYDYATGFLPPKSKWHVYLKIHNPKLWDVAVLFHIRDAFRSMDMWLR